MPEASVRSPRSSFRIRPTSGWAALNLAEIWCFRDVVYMLALRDIKLRYKQTSLGVFWVVLQPVMAAAILSLVFGRFAKLPSDGKPYLPFAFAGLLGWNLFASILQRAGNSLVAESRLITKVYFPRILLPLAGAVSGLLDFLIGLVVMAGILAFYGLSSGTWLGILPVAVLVDLILAVGMSLWISALNVRYRDFMYALPFLIQIWMYGSPVVYGLTLVGPAWRTWFLLNPMVGILECFRKSLLGRSSFTWPDFGLSAAVALVIFIGGAYFFRRVEREFADRL